MVVERDPTVAPWAMIGGAVIAWELFGPKTLSEGVDVALERHPILTRAVIGITALHLLNALPPSVDPFYQLTRRLT